MVSIPGVRLLAACAVGAALMVAPWGSVRPAGAAENQTLVESVKSDIEDKLGLTPEKKARIREIREEFKARRRALKSELNLKTAALTEALDAEKLDRAKVAAIVVEIKALQGTLVDNHVDFVLRTRELYTPRQLKMIRSRLEDQAKKAATAKKKAKPADVVPAKKKSPFVKAGEKTGR